MATALAFGIIGLAGIGVALNKQATENETNNTTSSINSIIMSALTTETATSTVINTGSQDMKVVIKKLDHCDNVGNITQTIKNTQNVKININLSSKNDLKAQLTAALSNATTTDTNQKQGSLSIAQGSDVSNKNNSSIFFSSYLTDTMISQMMTDINIRLKDIQSGTLEIDDCYYSNNSGNITQSIVAQQIANIIIKIIVGNTAWAKYQENLSNDIFDRIKQTITGIIDSIVNWFKNLWDSLLAGELGPIALCVILCLGMFYFIFGKKKTVEATKAVTHLPKKVIHQFGKMLKKLIR